MLGKEKLKKRERTWSDREKGKDWSLEGLWKWEKKVGVGRRKERERDRQIVRHSETETETERQRDRLTRVVYIITTYWKNYRYIWMLMIYF